MVLLNDCPVACFRKSSDKCLLGPKLENVCLEICSLYSLASNALKINVLKNYLFNAHKTTS